MSIPQCCRRLRGRPRGFSGVRNNLSGIFLVVHRLHGIPPVIRREHKRKSDKCYINLYTVTVAESELAELQNYKLMTMVYSDEALFRCNLCRLCGDVLCKTTHCIKNKVPKETRIKHIINYVLRGTYPQSIM